MCYVSGGSLTLPNVASYSNPINDGRLQDFQTNLQASEGGSLNLPGLTQLGTVDELP